MTLNPSLSSDPSTIHRLFAGVQDISSSDLTLVHLVIHHLELGKADNLEWCLDQATSVEVNGLGGVLAVTNVGTLNPDHLDDRLENGGLQVGTSWETDADDSSAWSDVLSSLLEGLLVDSNENDSVGTKAIGSGLLDVSDDILARGKVDESLGTELFGTHLLLLVTCVDGNGAKTHGLCVLASQGTETTSSTDDGDVLTRLSTGLLKTLVDGDTGTENWGNRGQVAPLGDACYVSGLSNAVLLEGTVDGVAGKKGLGAQWLISLLAEVAGEAGAVKPFDTGLVANLDVVD
jgi:hypothetical protein